MKKFVLLLSFLLPMLVHAQDTGIHFEHTLTWQQIQAKAKAENKYIFIDCFTTWCGPCKYMSASVFPLKNVGEFMNDKFVSLKIQLDTTANDNDAVKAWYKDGHEIAGKYDVQVYPTYLIFGPDGTIVHRFVGSSPAEEFIGAVKKSLNPETQYYTALNQYKNGKKDNDFLFTTALTAADAYDMETAYKIANEYLETQTDLYTKDNINFIKKFTRSSKDKGFDMMLHHADKVDEVAGKGTAANTVQSIIMSEEVFSKFSRDKKATPDWSAMKNSIEQKYPGMDMSDKTVSKAKVMWYQFAADWNNYQTAVVYYVTKYGAALSPDELNNFAWNVFENCPDMKCVAKALEWSKRSFEGNNSPMFIDTYANILYKLGRKKEAIKWETKAMDYAQGDDKKSYAEVIEKMKKGDKTWN